jgi:hypothetical protein
MVLLSLSEAIFIDIETTHNLHMSSRVCDDINFLLMFFSKQTKGVLHAKHLLTTRRPGPLAIWNY